MHSIDHLFDRLIEPDIIEQAIRKSSLGKRNRPDVKYCLQNTSKAVRKIRNMLIAETYIPPHHTEKEINDGITRKKRLIVEPQYMYEQIIHHAIVQTIGYSIYMSSYEYSCGSMPGRGAVHGKKYIERFIKRNPDKSKYVLKLDIHHFFQSIDHDLLIAKMHKYWHDAKFNRLMELIVRSYHGEEGKGIPIGFYTSQWLANWYLQDLDYFIKQELHAGCYVRYMDDLCIFAESKEELHWMKRKIEEFLSNLKLDLNHKWQIFPLNSRPLDFMGFRFYLTRTVLRKTILLRATRKAKRMQHITWYNSAQMMSYLGWFKQCSVHNVYLKYIKPYVKIRQLRRCLSKHSRRNKNDYKLEKKRKYYPTTRCGDFYRLCSVA